MFSEREGMDLAVCACVFLAFSGLTSQLWFDIRLTTTTLNSSSHLTTTHQLLISQLLLSCFLSQAASLREAQEQLAQMRSLVAVNQQGDTNAHPTIFLSVDLEW